MFFQGNGCGGPTDRQSYGVRTRVGVSFQPANKTTTCSYAVIGVACNEQKYFYTSLQVIFNVIEVIYFYAV